jgi:hypothetical protein
VSAIAIRWILSLYAKAHPSRFILLRLENQWRQIGTVVGAITERLIVRQPTGTPCVVLSRFKLNFDGLLSGDLWLGHSAFPFDRCCFGVFSYRHRQIASQSSRPFPSSTS